jgi:cytidine deaminase
MSTDVEWGELRDAARRVRDSAYAPYSSLLVGAALRADGKVFAGCNVENASFPVGLCAERAALATAVAAGCRAIEALAIASERPIPPCGMCRQALAEFNPALPILLVGDEEEQVESLDRLLPNPFSCGSQ